MATDEDMVRVPVQNLDCQASRPSRVFGENWPRHNLQNSVLTKDLLVDPIADFDQLISGTV